MKLVRSLAAIGLGLALGAAQAGPVIIAGTDADDHGNSNGVVNFTGWLFMEEAFENLAPAVTNGQKTVTCIGCNPGGALSAFNSATGLSSLPGAGWTFNVLTSAADIQGFFDGTGAVDTGNTGILYMPTSTNNVGGGITDAQLGVVNANAVALNAFVAAGGGLFTQEQNSAGAAVRYGWLTSLLPGLNFHGDNDGTIVNSVSLTLTAAGNTAFPALTDAILSNATPWHGWFDGNLGGLQVLVTGPARSVTGQTIAGAVVIGGGSGTVIQCGQPGQPPCPRNVPEPESLPLLGMGLAALAFALRRRLRT